MVIVVITVSKNQCALALADKLPVAQVLDSTNALLNMENDIMSGQGTFILHQLL